MIDIHYAQKNLKINTDLLCAHHLRKIFHEVSHERAKFCAECARFSAEGAEKFFKFGTKLRKFFFSFAPKARRNFFSFAPEARENFFDIYVSKIFFTYFARGQKTEDRIRARSSRQKTGFWPF